MKRVQALLAAGALLGTLLLPDWGLPAAYASGCPNFNSQVTTGNINAASVTVNGVTDNLSELSGIAASVNNKNVLWTHNDSGHKSWVYAFNTDAKLLGIYKHSNLALTDWEDIAIGPGPVAGQSYLYIGDIGGNGGGRSNVVVYRVPEPTVTTAANPPSNPANAPVANFSGVEKFTLHYGDGNSHDAEAMMVDPISGDLYIIAKVFNQSPAKVFHVAAADLTTTQTVTAAQATTITNLAAIVAADISPDGKYIAVKGYNDTYMWVREPGQSVEDAIAAEPTPSCSIPNGAGEALGYAHDSGYYTLAEGTNMPLHYFGKVFDGVSIGHTGTAPAIDGNVDTVWTTQTSYPIDNLIAGTRQSQADLSGDVQALWDSNNLYMLVNVKDDAKVRDSGSNYGGDDQVAIFFDSDNSKTTTYGSDDFNFRLVWNDPTVHEKNNHTTGVVFAKTDLTDGYRMEIKIPWSTLGVAAPASGKIVGFDAQINDDDDGGAQDARTAWWGLVHNAYDIPAMFGTAKLQ